MVLRGGGGIEVRSRKKGRKSEREEKIKGGNGGTKKGKKMHVLIKFFPKYHQVSKYFPPEFFVVK